MPSMIIPGIPQPGQESNLPDWMKAAIGNVGQIGPGAASYVSTSGPQDFATLKRIYDESLGGAPMEADPNAIKSIFGDAINAAMGLGMEQVRGSEADRGAAVTSQQQGSAPGVLQQQARDLGLKVQAPLADALLKNLMGGVQNRQSSLSKLFESASGPQSNSLGYRNTTQDINSQLPPYVQQSNPGGGGGTTNNSNSFSSPGGSARPGGGSSGGSGGGGGGAPWWQTSYGDMNNGAGAAWNDAHPGSLAGWNPGGVPGGSGPATNPWAADTPTGGSVSPNMPEGNPSGLGGAGIWGNQAPAPSSRNAQTGLTWDNVNGYFIDDKGLRAS